MATKKIGESMGLSGNLIVTGTDSRAARAKALAAQCREDITALRDAVREGRVIEFRERDPIVLRLHEAADLLDTFATQEQRMFRIQDGGDIPWAVIAPWDKQAYSNHHQALERLHERGGLGCNEAIAVLTAKSYNFYTFAQPEANLRLQALVRERLATQAGQTCEAAFKEGWRVGYYDGGEHDCRMFPPTAERAWDDYRRGAGWAPKEDAE